MMLRNSSKQILNCENCGAPLSLKNLEECIYCKSITSFTRNYKLFNFPLITTSSVAPLVSFRNSYYELE